MNSARPIRRVAALGIAVALAVGALIGVAAPAQASTSNAANAAKVIATINAFRVAHSLPTLLQNQYLSAYAQGWTHALQVCDTPAGNLNTAASCADSAPETVYAPSGSTSETGAYATNTGANLESTLATNVTTHFAAQLEATVNYVGVGYYVKNGVGFVGVMLYYYPKTPFASDGAVTITSHPVVGVPISPHFTGFSPKPTSYTYDWDSNGHEVATNVATYTPVGTDLGNTITLTVNASKSGYLSQNNITTTASHVVAAGTLSAPSSPKLYTEGTFNVGEDLQWNAGSWPVSLTSLDIQWLRNGKVIPGATDDGYPLTSADLGKRIDVRMTAVATGYVTKVVQTHNTKTIGAPLLTTAPTPTTAGTPVYGQTLTAIVGSAWGPGMVHISYSWSLDGVKVSGATQINYKLPLSAIGKHVQVTVTGTESGYAATKRVSLGVLVHGKAFTDPGEVTFSGSHTVGSTLTASHGTWTPTPTSYSYKWLRAGVAIPGATKSTYKLTLSDLGQTLEVDVTAHKTGYAAEYSSFASAIS